MGSPISDLLFEIYMEHFKTNNIINNYIYILYIRAYFKYVDGNFELFRGLCRKTENIVICLSNINKHIQFIHEKQINNKLNFFDLSMTVINNFSYYREPTNTRCYNTT